MKHATAEDLHLEGRQRLRIWEGIAFGMESEV